MPGFFIDLGYTDNLIVIHAIEMKGQYRLLSKIRLFLTAYNNIEASLATYTHTRVKRNTETSWDVYEYIWILNYYLVCIGVVADLFTYIYIVQL